MRIISFLAFVLVLLSTQQAVAQQQITSSELKNLAGQPVDLAQVLQDADLTVISFWATWCKPCQAEMDAIADLYPEWKEQLGVQMVAITIDTQRALSKVPGLISTKGWEYIILSDVNNVMRNQLGFQAIPQTYVVDRDGKVLYSHSGYTTGDELELEAKLKELAGK